MALAIKGGKKGPGAKKSPASLPSTKKKRQSASMMEAIAPGADSEEEVAAAEEAASKPTRRKKNSSRNESADGLTDEDLRDLVPAGMASSFVESKLHDKALEVAGLGEPSDWNGDMPELSNDVANVDHDELANLLAQFTNAMSSSLWHASKNYVEADAYEEIADYLQSVAVLESNQSNEQKRRAEAETQDVVVAARTMQKRCYRNYVRFRDNSKTLEHRMRAVSRIGGFVGEEAEGEELGSLKSSTRGKSRGARSGSKGSVKKLAKR